MKKKKLGYEEIAEISLITGDWNYLELYKAELEKQKKDNKKGEK